MNYREYMKKWATPEMLRLDALRDLERQLENACPEFKLPMGAGTSVRPEFWTRIDRYGRLHVEGIIEAKDVPRFVEWLKTVYELGDA